MFLKRIFSFFLVFIILFQNFSPILCSAYEFTYTNLPDKNDYPQNAEGATAFYWDTALMFINNSSDFIEPIVFSMDNNKKQEYNDFFGVDIFTDDGDYAPLSSLLTDYYIDHRNYKDSGGYRPGSGLDNISPEYSFMPPNSNSTFISDGFGGGFTVVNNSQYTGPYTSSYDCAIYYNGKVIDHKTGSSNLMFMMGGNYLRDEPEDFAKFSGIPYYGFSLPEYKYSLSKSPDGKSMTFYYAFYTPCSDNISDKVVFDYLNIPENPDFSFFPYRYKTLYFDGYSNGERVFKFYPNYSLSSITLSRYTVNQPLESSVNEYNDYFRFVTYNPVTNNVDNSQNITYGADNSGQSCYYYNNEPYSFVNNVNNDGTVKIGSDNVFLIPDYKTLNQTDKNGISDLIKNWYLMQLLRLAGKQNTDLAPLYNYLASMLSSFSSLSSMVGNLQTLLKNIYDAIRNINQLNPYDQLMLNELINIKNLLMLGSGGTGDKLSLEKIEKLLEQIEKNTRPVEDDDGEISAEDFEIDIDIQDVMEEFYSKIDVPGYFKLFQLAFKNLTGRDIDIDLTDYLSVEKYLASDETKESSVAPLIEEATEENYMQARVKSVSYSTRNLSTYSFSSGMSDVSIEFGGGHSDVFASIEGLNLFSMLSDVDSDFEAHLASARNLVRIFLVVSFMFYEFRKITQLIQAVFGSDSDISSVLPQRFKKK